MSFKCHNITMSMPPFFFHNITCTKTMSNFTELFLLNITKKYISINDLIYDILKLYKVLKIYDLSMDT